MRRGVGDLLGELCLCLRRRSEREPLFRGVRHRAHDLLARMPENERAPAHHIVKIAVFFLVNKTGALSAHGKKRRSAYGAECAHGRIHTAGQNAAGALKQFGIVHACSPFLASARFAHSSA